MNEMPLSGARTPLSPIATNQQFYIGKYNILKYHETLLYETHCFTVRVPTVAHSNKSTTLCLKLERFGVP